MSQEKLQTMVMQKFCGVIRVYYGIVQVLNCRVCYRAFSLTWPAAILDYWNKRRYLHKNSIQCPEDQFGVPSWLPFLCFGTLTWLLWRHVNTLYFFNLVPRVLSLPSSRKEERGPWERGCYFFSSTVCHEKIPKCIRICNCIFLSFTKAPKLIIF